MNDEFVNDVLRDMLSYLDNGQAEQLRRVLKHNLSGYEIQRRTDSTAEDASIENARLTGAFLSAKRIEGCSEKSLSYYRKTIETMSEKIGKGITHITTNELAIRQSENPVRLRLTTSAESYPASFPGLKMKITS